VAIRTYGTMGVDWEQRIDFDRLRTERLARITALLATSEMGALLCFDMNNVRYITATHIGTWAQDKISRFTLLPQNAEPILWDFGSAARHHQLNCPWLGDRSRAGIALLRGAMTPEMGRAEDVAKKIRVELEARGLLGDPVGIDVVEPPILFALQREGVKVVDGQQLMSDAREIKTQDEISLLTHSAMMVDAAYHELYHAMKPGMRENECVGLVSKVLYDLGSEHVEWVNAISGERANPHPHVYSDRVLRPGDPSWREALVGAAVGVTGAALAVAQTGSLVLTPGPGAPRATSLLPGVHVCLVATTDVVATIVEAIDALAARDLPSAVVWVGGPSRTSDLEMRPTFGIHGPKAVEVVLVDIP